MSSKICTNCGCEVDSSVNFCPDCGSKSFNSLEVPKVVNNSKPALKYTLLYWNYDGQFILSKSKIVGISAFLILFLSFMFSPTFGVGGIIVSLIISLLIFLIGFSFHKLSQGPSKNILKYNDYGLIIDLKHFLLYWQNKNTGEFVLSKTKIISNLVFIIFALIATRSPAPTLFVIILVGLFFEIPTFIVGYGIHKLTNQNPTNPKREISKPKEIPKSKEVPKSKTVPKKTIPEKHIVPEFIKYDNQINALNEEFSTKEANVRKLIEKTFKPPQLTYTKFISVVDKSSELFRNQVDLSKTMINLTSEYSPKIENELKLKIDTLKTITDKLDDLTDELILTRDKSENDDVNNLFGEMEDLIKSVKDYD